VAQPLVNITPALICLGGVAAVNPRSDDLPSGKAPSARPAVGTSSQKTVRFAGAANDWVAAWKGAKGNHVSKKHQHSFHSTCASETAARVAVAPDAAAAVAAAAAAAAAAGHLLGTLVAFGPH
jgi:hypothetical protein